MKSRNRIWWLKQRKSRLLVMCKKLNKTEVDDVYKQLKHLREKYDSARRTITTRFPGQKPPTKSYNIPAPKFFNLKVLKPSQTETELEFSEDQ